MQIVEQPNGAVKHNSVDKLDQRIALKRLMLTFELNVRVLDLHF